MQVQPPSPPAPIHTVPPAGYLAESDKGMSGMTEKRGSTRKVSDVNDAKSRGSSKTPSKNGGISQSGGKRRTAVEEYDFDDLRTHTEAEGQEAMDESAVNNAIWDTSGALRDSAVANELRHLDVLQHSMQFSANYGTPDNFELHQRMKEIRFNSTRREAIRNLGQNRLVGRNPLSPSATELREQGLSRLSRSDSALRQREVAQMTKMAEDACLEAGYRSSPDQAKVSS
jgi:hypothetical protein